MMMNYYIYNAVNDKYVYVTGTGRKTAARWDVPNSVNGHFSGDDIDFIQGMMDSGHFTPAPASMGRELHEKLGSVIGLLVTSKIEGHYIWYIESKLVKADFMGSTNGLFDLGRVLEC